MNKYRFYLEFRSRQEREQGVHTGNCIAVLVDEEDDYVLNSFGYIEAVLPTYHYPDSAVYGGEVSDHVLDTFCSPISEQEARRIHSRLFEYLGGGR